MSPGVFSWRVGGEMTWSDEVFAIFGYTRGVAPSAQRMLDRVHPDDADRVAAAMVRAHDWRCDFMLRIDDVTKHVRISAKRVGDGWIAAVVDASPLASMGHEVRTAMNTVLGMTELVLQTAVTDEQRQWLHTAKSAADDLLGFVDEISRPVAPQRASLRILVVDADDERARWLRQLLYRRGHRADLAGDPRAYDLVLTDGEVATERPTFFLRHPIHVSSLWVMVDRIAEAAAPAPRVIDAAALLSACDGSQDILDRVLAALRAQLPKELAEAHARFDAGDALGLRETAHRLQGMISTASTVVAVVASELEDEASWHRLETSAALLARLDAMTRRLLTSLEGITIDDLHAAADAEG